MLKDVGENPSAEKVKDYVVQTLEGGVGIIYSRHLKLTSESSYVAWPKFPIETVIDCVFSCHTILCSQLEQSLQQIYASVSSIWFQ